MVGKGWIGKFPRFTSLLLLCFKEILFWFHFFHSKFPDLSFHKQGIFFSASLSFRLQNRANLIPSSNNARDFSKGWSPLSNFSTISSRRFRASSNFWGFLAFRHSPPPYAILPGHLSLMHTDINFITNLYLAYILTIFFSGNGMFMLYPRPNTPKGLNALRLLIRASNNWRKSASWCSTESFNRFSEFSSLSCHIVNFVLGLLTCNRVIAFLILLLQIVNSCVTWRWSLSDISSTRGNTLPTFWSVE